MLVLSSEYLQFNVLVSSNPFQGNNLFSWFWIRIYELFKQYLLIKRVNDSFKNVSVHRL